MKGYPTAYGYMGYIPGEGYTLFMTEDEYVKYYRKEVLEAKGE